jgi:hypothetical protein
MVYFRETLIPALWPNGSPNNFQTMGLLGEAYLPLGLFACKMGKLFHRAAGLNRLLVIVSKLLIALCDPGRPKASLRIET